MTKVETQPNDSVLTHLALTDQREIGRGATATVFVARQSHLSRDVAIKVFAQPLLGAKSRRRFERECQALGMVSAHPNVVTLLSNGFDESNRPFIVMEYCPGGSLYDVINTSGPLAVADVLRIGIKICSALQLAHDNGLMHRDIKPANVLLTAMKEPALADFGIAGDPRELSVTVGDSLTPLYAAPEVLESGGGSPASDVWSLASTLYALLLGQAPYAGTNDGLLALLNRIIQAPLPPLDRDDVPDCVLAALVAGIEKDPRKRTASARELAEALQHAQREMGLTVTEYLTASTADLAQPRDAQLVDLTAARGQAERSPEVLIPDQAAVTGVRRIRDSDLGKNSIDDLSGSRTQQSKRQVETPAPQAGRRKGRWRPRRSAVASGVAPAAPPALPPPPPEQSGAGVETNPPRAGRRVQPALELPADKPAFELPAEGGGSEADNPSAANVVATSPQDAQPHRPAPRKHLFAIGGSLFTVVLVAVVVVTLSQHPAPNSVAKAAALRAGAGLPAPHISASCRGYICHIQDRRSLPRGSKLQVKFGDGHRAVSSTGRLSHDYRHADRFRLAATVVEHGHASSVARVTVVLHSWHRRVHLAAAGLHNRHLIVHASTPQRACSARVATIESATDSSGWRVIGTRQLGAGATRVSVGEYGRFRVILPQRGVSGGVCHRAVSHPVMITPVVHSQSPQATTPLPPSGTSTTSPGSGEGSGVNTQGGASHHRGRHWNNPLGGGNR